MQSRQPARPSLLRRQKKNLTYLWKEETTFYTRWWCMQAANRLFAVHRVWAVAPFWAVQTEACWQQSFLDREIWRALSSTSAVDIVLQGHGVLRAGAGVQSLTEGNDGTLQVKPVSALAGEWAPGRQCCCNYEPWARHSGLTHRTASPRLPPAPPPWPSRTDLPR